MSDTARRVGLAALLLGASQLLSRLLGIVRESVLAWSVGAGPAADAYRAAFQLPDLLNHFLAVGAISTAFIPLYHRALERSGRAEADRVFAVIWGTLAAAVTLATAALFLAVDPFVALYFPDFPPEQQALTARLTRIVLPAQLFFVVGGIVRGVLMAHGRFGAQAVAPLLYNLGIIAGGLTGAGRLGVEGFAWGALGGAAVGHLLVPLLDARGRIPLRMRVAPLDPAFRRYAVIALPLVVGVTLLTGDEWLDRYFGQFVGAGAIALLFYARSLMQAPVGLVGQAVGTAALPALSRLHEAGRHEELGVLVRQTLQATLSFAVLVAAGLAAVAAPAVTLIYLRGAFSPADAAEVTRLLRVFCAAIPAWVVQSVAVRPFYARGDTWRPMLLGTGVLLLAVPLYAWLGRSHGTSGLAAAGALAISANALATLLLARRLHGAPSLLALARTGAAALAAALPGAAAAWWVQRGGEGVLGALLDLALGGAAFCAVALPIAWWVGGEPLRAALARLLRRGA
jgi:putative peptidoglycan lipid II flippase